MTESPREFDELRLRELSLARCNELLSEVELEELSAILRSSAEARRNFRELTAVHAQLGWERGGKDTVASLLDSPCLEESLQLELQRAPVAATTPTWSLALSLCLLVGVLGAGLLFWHNAGQPEPQLSHVTPPITRTVGTIAALRDGSHWSFGRPGGDNTDAVHPGDTLWLKRGALELRLITDTSMHVEAPAIVQVLSKDRVRLINGNIKVDVPDGAEGFAVESDSVEVIDLGTSFSVGVADEQTDVVVFEGEVNLKLQSKTRKGKNGPEQVVRHFHTGDAVRVSSDGTFSRIVEVRDSPIGIENDEGVEEALIASVKDNNVREDHWKFYHIVPGGMDEDVLAFVDRRGHQWNGATQAGMPGYLIGGDLVRTFNDDKATDDLVIRLQLAEPATVYVLLDERVSRPAWLIESFEDTGDDVGIDQGFTGGTGGPPSIGPGKSIEHRMNVWKQVVPQAGEVLLGPNGEVLRKDYRGTSVRANMYGIVAVPLAAD
ncbi:FecR family protein [Aeoliella sp. ICT_H6.2]|uniref:FecR family protein n=1 Tax=Aeoliella straminimaris TaxID=2954799 RepID=A0A9X2JJH0_9BACT|nr:FecR family protein [Aeoliella straminimaris]MCO6048160.1 FecR family protein [Aeoliella straminimaris]